MRSRGGGPVLVMTDVERLQRVMYCRSRTAFRRTLPNPICNTRWPEELTAILPSVLHTHIHTSDTNTSAPVHSYKSSSMYITDGYFAFVFLMVAVHKKCFFNLLFLWCFWSISVYVFAYHCVTMPRILDLPDMWCIMYFVVALMLVSSFYSIFFLIVYLVVFLIYIKCHLFYISSLRSTFQIGYTDILFIKKSLLFLSLHSN